MRTIYRSSQPTKLAQVADYLIDLGFRAQVKKNRIAVPAYQLRAAAELF